MDEEKLSDHGTDIKIPTPDTDPLTQSILQHLRLNYEPAENMTEGLNLTTAELYDRILAIHPSPPFDSTYLATWLMEHGFRFADMGDLKFVWLIKAV